MLFGLLTIGVANVSAQTPTTVSVTPSSGSGFSQTFTMVYQDPTAATHITFAYVWFSTSTTGGAASSCQVRYNRSGTQFQLRNDGDSGWHPVPIGARRRERTASAC